MYWMEWKRRVSQSGYGREGQGWIQDFGRVGGLISIFTSGVGTGGAFLSCDCQG